MSGILQFCILARLPHLDRVWTMIIMHIGTLVIQALSNARAFMKAGINTVHLFTITA